VAEKCGVPLPAAEDSRESEERDRQRAELLKLNQWATEFFENSLTETGEGARALDYLAGRGISEESRRAFRLGYAPNSWDALSNHLARRGASRTLIERSGLVTLKDTGLGFYDRFRGRLMFPICDAQGRIIAFGGRILGEGEPKYLNSPETALYTKGQHLFGLNYAREEIRKKGYAILVEGYLDFLIPYQEGLCNLVASLGTALTEQQVRLLARYARKIVVNFDPDSAGVAATKRSLEALLGAGFKVNVLTLPDNLDPDEYIREQGAEGYQKLLKSSQTFLDYVVEQATREHDQTKPTGKVETLNAILPYLKLVKDQVERAEHVTRIADRLKIDSRLIFEEFKRAAETLIGEIREEDYAALRTAKLFRLIGELEREGREPSYTALSQGLEDEDLVQGLLPNLLIDQDGAGRPDQAQEERWGREAKESLYGLRYAQLAEQQAALQAEINHAQRSGDLARVSELTVRKFELAKQERALAQLTENGSKATSR
jgi:DNA primase